VPAASWSFCKQVRDDPASCVALSHFMTTGGSDLETDVSFPRSSLLQCQFIYVGRLHQSSHAFVLEVYLKFSFVPHSKRIMQGHKAFSVNAVWGNNSCLFSYLHKTHKYSVGRT